LYSGLSGIEQENETHDLQRTIRRVPARGRGPVLGAPAGGAAERMVGVMQLSPHFSLEELTFSSTAVRLGIDNTPPPEIVANLTQACSLFEQVRALLGVPMHTDSGYRCPALNAAVGGVPTSAHTLGWALDFTAPLFGTPLDIVRKIVASQMATQMKWDQLIQEGTWVHISAAPTMRQQVLTATFVNGEASYQQGIAP